ncbi:FAD:protein FMN transferase [Psychrobacter lutiphocae]|uniref:FAD:protein FMN transferase n=1 Tax=Psychrobacter lutiphocae TaxID=540500 RepID=UPI00036611AF|nr:FAD:protein FMN transferase [Psychrobacter lutiphocae]
MPYPMLSTKTVLTSSVILASTLTLTACQQSPQYQYMEGETMGTSYHITYQKPKDIDEAQIKQSIEQHLQAINDSMSTYQDDSTISKFNRLGAGQSLPVDEYFIKVLQDSKQVYQQSGGAFDPTIMPLINLWGFGSVMTVERLQDPPSDAEITTAKALIDFDGIELKGNQLSKTKDGVQLDFSAVAKGYGVDVIAQVLQNEYKINNYMIEIGGEVATSGVNQKTHAWQIAIDAPIIDSTVSERTTLAAIRQPKSSNKLHIATSGNYRNSIVFDGKRYSHTIDPTTGQPIVGGAPSVTVAAESVSIADAWATALTAMSYKDALSLATKKNIAALFIIPQDGKIHDDVASADEVRKNKANPQDYWQVVETPKMQALRADTGSL